MHVRAKKFNFKQLIFKELFVGTLIYAVVLGFFNDYTSILYAKSFSTIFYSAIVLELLTFGAFYIKGAIVETLKKHQGIIYRFIAFFFVWLVMFISKFVFVWAIDLTFGGSINIDGFFGILAIVLCVTVVSKLAEFIFIKLGDKG